MFRFFINQDDKKIRVISGLTLSALILSAGFSVYSVMQPQTEVMTTSGLRMALEDTVKLIENQISHSISNTKIIATSTLLTHSLEKTHTDESRQEGIAELQRVAEKILTTHFSGISIYDSEDNLILDAGVHSSQSNSSIELDTGAGIRTVLLCAGTVCYPQFLAYPQ